MGVNIRPLGGKIVLRVLEPEAEVRDGIHIPQVYRRDVRREGLVQRLPDGYRGDLNVGDVCILKPFIETEIVINGERLVICKERDLEAVVSG